MTRYPEGRIFRDNIDGEVERFVITEIGDNSYEVVEYWDRPGAPGRWQRYRKGMDELDAQVGRGFAEPIGRATDDELDALDALVDADPDEYEFVESVYGL